MAGSRARPAPEVCLALGPVVNCPPMRERPVGPFALLALGVNGIVGVGIFFIPATLGRLTPGPAGILVFAITGLCLVPVALVFATLARRFDEDGGPVLFARAAFGERVSFLVGWLAYVSAILSTSAVMSGLVTAAAPGLGVSGPTATPARARHPRHRPRAGGGGGNLHLGRGLDGADGLEAAPPIGPRGPVPCLGCPAGQRRPDFRALPFRGDFRRRGDPRLGPRHPHRALRLPGLRDRARHRGPGAQPAAVRALRHRGLARPLLPALRRAHVGLRGHPARPRASRRSPGGGGSRAGRRGLRLAGRAGHQHLRPRHLPGHDGDHPALPLGAGRGGTASLRSRPLRGERRAPAGPRGHLGLRDADRAGR